MSFKAKFKVDGREYDVLDCTYDAAQEVDATGRPSSVNRAGRVKLTVQGDGTTALFEWMCNNFERKNGSVQFVKRDSDATLKELKFTEGYLVKYQENFDSTGTNPLTETFTISARQLEIGEAQHDNEWV